MTVTGVRDRGAGVTSLGLWLAALVVAAIAPAAAARPLDAGRIDAFLDRIEGPWQGQAVITPIGPRPYDIDFKWNSSGELAGAAHPGSSIHYWSFHREDEDLRLRFLTTFSGNRQPILMTANDEADGALIFRALRPDFLSVRIRAEPHTLVIQVFHHERLHVEIRLRR
jgi:hypothetical protein